MFMAHDPQIPSRQERLKVRVLSCSFLIIIKASRTIGPHLSILTENDCIFGFSFGLSGFHLYISNFFIFAGTTLVTWILRTLNVIRILLFQTFNCNYYVIVLKNMYVDIWWGIYLQYLLDWKRACWLWIVAVPLPFSVQN